ncbi:MAG: aldo/keto reductase [Bacteroidetes bacterium MedPE-SWsnd-G2]|nr:MAG: aldo/keto reductase [Bacteroidetes bacterium MedPE-SWsnd-G2]
MGNYSKIIAGTMTWGAWGKKLSKLEMSNLVHTCLELGITTFDHADIYGDYSTEEEFGAALKASNCSRPDIQLISKCGIQLLSEKRPNTIKHYNYSKDYIIETANNSLKHLHTDYLDTFLLHRPSPLLKVEEVFEAFTRLKKEGKVKTFGVSNFTNTQTELLLNAGIDIKVNQIECSLTQASAMFDGSLDYMSVKNIQPMAWSPLGAVFKTDNLRSKDLLNLINVLCDDYNASADQIILAWLMQHPSRIIPVVGTTTSSRLKNAIEATTITLNLEDWFKLLEAAQGQPVP